MSFDGISNRWILSFVYDRVCQNLQFLESRPFDPSTPSQSCVTSTRQGGSWDLIIWWWRFEWVVLKTVFRSQGVVHPNTVASTKRVWFADASLFYYFYLRCLRKYWIKIFSVDDQCIYFGPCSIHFPLMCSYSCDRPSLGTSGTTYD